MNDPSVLLVWTYFIGMFASVGVMRVRCGVGIWHRPKILGPDGFGIVWVVTVVLCSMVWPVTLAVWLFRGRPEPRVVFNEKAAERHRRQAAGGAR